MPIRTSQSPKWCLCLVRFHINSKIQSKSTRQRWKKKIFVGWQKWQIEISKWLLIIGQSTNLSCDRFKNKNTAASIEDILKSHILLLDHWLVVCHKNIHHYHCHSLTLFVLHLWHWLHNCCQYDRHFLCNAKLTWGEKINFQEVFCVTLLLFLKTQMITCLCTVGGSP